MDNQLMDKLVSLCKRRGYVFPGSEIYGGLANTWDFGPLGVELKNNIKKFWWQTMVWQRDDVVGLDSSIIMNPKVWEASGHVSNFSDPLIDCKNCKSRFRADELMAGKYGDISMKDGKTSCPLCGGELTESRKFNMMFKTFVGPMEDSSSLIYLRPETAQGIFNNFKQVLNVSRKKIPFGIAQIGKAFRNEITPGNFIFRTLEFEQMEMEFFVKPDSDRRWYNYWVSERFDWYLKLGLKKENIRKRPHEKNELAHYAKACTDIEYSFPFASLGEDGRPWGELEGIANRTDYDLSNHMEHSGKDLNYFDEINKASFLPYVIEPSAGMDRMTLAVLIDAYHEEKDENGEIRIVLKINPKIAPIKVAILPLVKNKENIVKLSQKLYQSLRSEFMVDYDEIGSIGRRYRRQDEAGTPYCLTVDFDSLEDKAVTLRDRDTMKQERINISEINDWLRDKLK
ncbi:MAG: glycine--tRNA ligase [Candidatus Parcubacteria bacterium]|nr:glycine--tRNA ligase [Candidatus Parcubacteria bacterium]